MTEVKGTLKFEDKQKTSYCISSDQRDENIKIAMRKIKGRIEQEDIKTESCAVLGYGPSLVDTWEQVKKFDYIFTTSGALQFLLSKGIKVTDFKRWFHLDLDPRSHKVKILGEPPPEIEYLIASTIHPNYLEKLNQSGCTKTKLWHIFATDDESLRILPEGEWAFTGGSDVGMRALVIARFLGFKDLHVFGMDGSLGDSGFHAGKHPNQPPYSMETEYKGKKFLTTPALISCAKQFPYEMDQLTDVTLTFYGEGLIQEIMKDYKRNPDNGGYIWFIKPETISDSHKELNRKLHEDNVMYGAGGGKHKDRVIAILKGMITEENPFPSCLDFGCGKGFLAKSLPFPIYEYDPAIPGKDESPKPADLVVCTDVLEHIEPDKLKALLGELARCVKQVGFFVISTRKAVKTYANGQNTHLIVKGAEWWEKQLKKHFDVPIGGIVVDKENAELRIVVAPKTKAVAESVTEIDYKDKKVKFSTPNETTEWRAKTVLTKEPATIEWLDSMKEGEVFYDVGACIGSYSLLAGVQGLKVYAFEPEVENYATLVKNIELNKLDAKAYCLAASDKQEVGVLYTTPGGAGQSCHSFNQPSEYSRVSRKRGCLSMTLDQMVEMGLPSPDHLKIDVDGLEMKVIKGAEHILKNGLKSMLVEVDSNKPEHQEMVEYICSLGYVFSEEQVEKAKRKEGTFKGVAEFVFTKDPKSKWLDATKGSRLHNFTVVDTVEETLCKRIEETAMDLEPFNYLYVENLFPVNTYISILDSLEHIKYEEIEKTRGTKGYPKRFTATPDTELWKGINKSLTSGGFKKALLDKFGITDQEYTEDILLVRDFEGYQIPPHTDSLNKIITVLIYLPEDGSMEQEGTSLFVPKDLKYTDKTGKHHDFKDFYKVYTAPFRPNSALIFARTDNSFHGVEPSKHVRNVLLYNIKTK